MKSPALISVDWGTTTLRCVLLDRDGAILDRRDDGPGIQPPPPLGFAGTLGREIKAWATGPLPILMSGMIGSRQGWVEVPYLDCPAGAGELAKALHQLDAGPLGSIYIIPGLARTAANTPPEVMRGEETQIIGALSTGATPAHGQRLFVLPGSHSKWATTSDGAITSFATYMTGEVFAALRHHTILGRLMPQGETPFDAAGFDRGVDAGALSGHPGSLLNRLFATRTLGLFDRLPASALESYLSGLLLGAELATAAATSPGALTIIGSAKLSRNYLRAAQRLGFTADIAMPDCAPRGHWLIARAAGLLKATTP